jgi:hypothetical protein
VPAVVAVLSVVVARCRPAQSVDCTSNMRVLLCLGNPRKFLWEPQVARYDPNARGNPCPRRQPCHNAAERVPRGGVGKARLIAPKGS